MSCVEMAFAFLCIGREVSDCASAERCSPRHSGMSDHNVAKERNAGTTRSGN